MSRREKLQVNLDKDQWDALHALSQRTQIPMSAIARTKGMKRNRMKYLLRLLGVMEWWSIGIWVDSNAPSPHAPD